MKGALLLFSCWDVTLFLKKKNVKKYQRPASFSPFLLLVSQHVSKEDRIFKLFFISKIFRERCTVIVWYIYTCIILVSVSGKVVLGSCLPLRGSWKYMSFWHVRDTNLIIIYVFPNCSSLLHPPILIKMFDQATILWSEGNFWLEYFWETQNQCL